MEFLERRSSMAIEISHVCKSYGRGGRKADVLKDFQMNIPRGHIYGLLGQYHAQLSPIVEYYIFLRT